MRLLSVRMVRNFLSTILCNHPRHQPSSQYSQFSAVGHSSRIIRMFVYVCHAYMALINVRAVDDDDDHTKYTSEKYPIIYRRTKQETTRKHHKHVHTRLSEELRTRDSYWERWRKYMRITRNQMPSDEKASSNHTPVTTKTATKTTSIGMRSAGQLY